MFGTLRPGCGSDCATGSYRSNFCGACHNLAEWGRGWSLATGFDFAFLHLLLVALEGAEEQTAACTALPWRQLPVRSASAEGRQWLNAFYFLLMREKCRDDVADGESLRGRLGLKLLSQRAVLAEEILQRAGFPLKNLTSLNERQNQAELSSDPTLESLFQPTSDILGDTFRHLATLARRPECEVGLRQLGKGLGAAIYLKDALEDRDKDSKRGRFNALVTCDCSPAKARAVISRELALARVGLDALELGADKSTVESVLEQLESSVSPSISAKPRRFRKQQRGVCDCLICCDLSVCCDAGVCCTAADGAACCDAAACCPVDCCCHVGVCTNEHSQKAPVAHTVTPPKKQLHCPACGSELVDDFVGFCTIDECRRCRGMWLDKGELDTLTSRPLPARFLKPQVPNAAPLRPEGTRPCPHCAETMQVNRIKGVNIDVCPTCQGIWLDQGELNKLL